MAEKTTKAVVDLVINGQSATLSVKDLGTAMKAVNKELREIAQADDPKKYAQLKAEKAKITEEYHKQKRAIGDVRSEWQKFTQQASTIAAGVFGGNILLSGLSKLKSGIVDTITGAAELDDQFSDIAKTTNLSAQEVEGLNRQLQDMDTRTSMESLRALAEEAGRLGKTSTDDIMAFIRGADMINVALGDVLGEGATKDIAKLSDIFKLTDMYGTEQGMLKIGSAINHVGMMSTANEGYMVDFLKRMSGIAGIAKVSAPELIGLAGTLDSLGQTSEVSSTSLSKLFVKMGSDVETYAKMAGQDIDDFRAALDRSAMEGFVMLLEGVNKTAGGIEELAATLDDLGLDGGRVVGVLGTLAQNTDELRRQTEGANSAFEEGTSIVNEFAIKNNNAAAVLEKVEKYLSNVWENIKVGAIPAITWFGRLVGAIDEMDESIAAVISQQDTLMNSEKKLPKLIERYEALNSKTEKSQEEFTELSKIMAEITEIAPEMATKYDEFGNVVDINTAKLAKHIDQQKEMLRLMKEETEGNLKLANQQKVLRAQEIQEALNAGSITKKVNIGMGQYRDQTKTLQAEDIKQLRSELSGLNKDIAKNTNAMNLINGVSATPVASTISTKSGNEPKTSTTPTAGKELSKEEQKSIGDLNKKLADLREKNQLAVLNGYEKEVQAAHNKYASLRKEAAGHKDKLTEINKLEAAEIEAISAKHNETYLSGFDKMMRGKLKSVNETSAERNELERKNQEDLLKLQEDERALIDRHYNRLILEAEQLGLDTKGIFEMWGIELNALKAKQLAEDYKLSKDINEKKKKDDDDLAESKKKALKEQLKDYELMKSAFSDISSSISDILEVAAKNSEDFAAFQKVLAIFTITVESASAVAKAITLATTSGITPWDMIAGIAAGVAAVTANFVKAKAIVNKAGEVPKAPAMKAVGGYTDVETLTRETGGYVGKATLFSSPGRQYIAGEAGTEFILNNRSLQYPAVAQFASMMDAIQTSKNYGALASIGSSGGSQIEMTAVIAELRALGNKVDSLANRPIEFPVTRFHEKEDFLMRIQNEVNA